MFRGSSTCDGKHVAIKVCEDEICFEREVQTLKLLADCGCQPCAMPLIDYSKSADGTPTDFDGVCYIVQELGDVSLAGTLRDGQRPLAEAPEICRDLLGALAHLHAFGFAHLDVKPDNVVRSFRSQCWRLIDFDSARPLWSEMSTHESWVFSERYVPPEVARSLLHDATALGRLHDANLSEDARLAVARAVVQAKEALRVFVTPALDLWSCGATLVEVCSLTAGFQLHSPGFDAFYEQPGLERPRDAFFTAWLDEAEGDVSASLPIMIDGADDLIRSLLQPQPSRRQARSAAQLLVETPFVLAAGDRPAIVDANSTPGGHTAGSHAPGGHARADAAQAAHYNPNPGGRWYGITGCTCDLCGSRCLELRHYCVTCDSFDLCTRCFVERHLARREHPHVFECSRDVTRYAWFESDAAAQASSASASVHADAAMDEDTAAGVAALSNTALATRKHMGPVGSEERPRQERPRQQRPGCLASSPVTWSLGRLIFNLRLGLRRCSRVAPEVTV